MSILSAHLPEIISYFSGQPSSPSTGYPVSNWMSVLGPALFAACIAVGITVVIEQLGGKKGGLIGTLPSTIVPAVWGFMNRAPDMDSFQTAALSAPFGMWLNLVFLYAWRFLPKKLPSSWGTSRLLIIVAASLGIWLVLAFVLVSVLHSLSISKSKLMVLSMGCTGVMAIMGIVACRSLTSAPKGKNKVGPLILVSRGLLAGGSIGLAVWLSGMGGPVAAGMASVFPAIYLTTMVSLFVSQGENVQAGAVGPMMLGSTSIAVFAIVSAFALPTWGTLWGALLAWIIAVTFTSVPAWIWLNRPRHTGRQDES